MTTTTAMIPPISVGDEAAEGYYNNAYIRYVNGYSHA
jgi:hypothetical protein